MSIYAQTYDSAGDAHLHKVAPTIAEQVDAIAHIVLPEHKRREVLMLFVTEGRDPDRNVEQVLNKREPLCGLWHIRAVTQAGQSYTFVFERTRLLEIK